MVVIKKASVKSLKAFVGLGGQVNGTIAVNYDVLNISLRSAGIDRKPTLELLDSFYKLLVETDFLPSIAYDVLVMHKTHAVISQEQGVDQGNIKNRVAAAVKKVYTALNGIDPYYEAINGNLGENEMASLRFLLNSLLNRQQMRTAANAMTNFIYDFRTNDRVPDLDTPLAYGDVISVLKVLRYLSKPWLQAKLASLNAETLGYVSYLLTTADTDLTASQQAYKHLTLGELRLASPAVLTEADKLILREAKYAAGLQKAPQPPVDHPDTK